MGQGQLRTRISGLIAALATLAWAISASADKHALLTIERTVNGLSDTVILSREDLEMLNQYSLRTENEFVDGPTLFIGPLARDVLDTVGRGLSDTVVLTAANDFQVEIPVSDFDKYDVVFAMSANGERLSRRDKGPIWVIYPTSQHKDLQDPVYNARLIWQLVRIDIK